MTLAELQEEAKKHGCVLCFARPVAWGWIDPDKSICDCIDPIEHERKPGQYTTPLYLAKEPQ